MAIVSCTCGFKKIVNDNLIGRKASCPKCKQSVSVVSEGMKSDSQKQTGQVLTKEKSQNNLNNTPGNSIEKTQWVDRNIPKYFTIILIVLVTILSFTSFFDKRNDQYFDKALKQAAASFAVAKTLNAVVSVVQDIDMTIEPFGVGVSVGAGEALDPVNDVIEKFSYVMFISTLSLGVQKIFAEVGRCLFIKAILGIASVVVIVLLLNESIPARDSAFSVFTKILMVFVVLRFAMPVVSTINKQVYDSVIQQNMAIEEKKLTILADEISNMDIINLPDASADKDSGKNAAKKQTTPTVQDSSATEAGVMGSVGKMWHSAVEKTGNAYGNATESVSNKWNGLKGVADPKEMKEKIDKLTKEISEASTYLVNLAVIFVFQTILSPLLVLWGLMKMTGYLMRSRV